MQSEETQVLLRNSSFVLFCYKILPSTHLTATGLCFQVQNLPSPPFYRLHRFNHILKKCVARRIMTHSFIIILYMTHHFLDLTSSNFAVFRNHMSFLPQRIFQECNNIVMSPRSWHRLFLNLFPLKRTTIMDKTPLRESILEHGNEAEVNSCTTEKRQLW